MNQSPLSSVQNRPVPKLFFLVGLPGSGKTFFAEKFSEEYQIPFINLNKWRFFMFGDPNFSREEDAQLTRYGADILREIFKTKQSILLEGNLYSRVDRQRYAQLARQYGYQPVVIWVQNVDAESKLRAIRLNRNHPKDFLMTPEVFEDLKRRFTPPNEIEKPIAISGKHSFKMQYRSVLKRIAGDSKPTAERSLPMAERKAINNADASSPKRRLRIFG